MNGNTIGLIVLTHQLARVKKKGVSTLNTLRVLTPFFNAYGADEAILTGTFGAQTPVAGIDGRQIGAQVAGPMFHRIRTLYRALIQRCVGAAA